MYKFALQQQEYQIQHQTQMISLLGLGMRRIGKMSTVKFSFKQRDGTLKPVTCEKGVHILDVAKANDVELQGACEASLACSTCHVILPEAIYSQLTPPKQQEEDLLDLAFGLTGTSRLGCQVIIDEKFEGTVVQLPKASRNLYVDGTKPKAH